MRPLVLFAFLGLSAFAVAQSNLTPGVRPFIAVDAPVIALEHVRVIDGTGAAPLEDRTVVIENGRIQSLNGPVPASAKRIDLTGRSIMPGLVGMHEHLFYPSFDRIPLYIGQGFSFPRLYLASGVTTARTAGTLEPQTDLNIKKMIDAGRMPGPKFL